MAGQFTDSQRLRIAGELDRHLGPEYIRTRDLHGCQQHFIEGHVARGLANETFGDGGWRASVREQSIEQITADGGPHLLATSLVRVTLRDGTFRDDVGTAAVRVAAGAAGQLDLCCNMATADATKRALRQFGRSLGGSLYDKQYLATLAGAVGSVLVQERG